MPKGANAATPHAPVEGVVGTVDPDDADNIAAAGGILSSAPTARPSVHPPIPTIGRKPSARRAHFVRLISSSDTCPQALPAARALPHRHSVRAQQVSRLRRTYS